MNAVVIAGPTASGKSAVALCVAQNFNGVIINADAIQVYRELRVLSARPGEADERLVPHRLYGFMPAAEAYSAARWLADLESTLQAVRQAGKLPVIVGGTGLYFKAAFEGLSPVPEISEAVRHHWREQAAVLGAEGLHKILLARDAETAARLRPGDTQRLTRALEVLEATGRPLSAWQKLAGKPALSEAETLRIVLNVERKALYQRCDARFARLVQQGGLREAQALMELGLPPALPAMRAIGVRPLFSHLKGRISLDDAVREAQMETRRYAKRQTTWLNRHMISWKLFDAQSSERTKQEINKIIMDGLDRTISAA